MKYLERLLEQGWSIDFFLADDGNFYIDVKKNESRRIGASSISLSKALENLLEKMKGDGVI